MMRMLAVALLLVPTTGLKLLKKQEAAPNNRDHWCEKGRLLPSVHLLGAQKAGSTSLFKDLTRRFDMHEAAVLQVNKQEKEADWMAKEVSFFADEPRFKKGRGFYLRHYPKCKDVGKNARGIDASIAFDHDVDYVNRVADFYGDKAKDLKFIVIVRDPVRRMESEFHHGEVMVGNQYDTGGLTKKVQKESKFENYVRDQLKDGGEAVQWAKSDQSKDPPMYFKGSSYAWMMKNWLKRFDASQFTVVTLKEYQAKTSTTLNLIGKRLGMPLTDSNELYEHFLANENKNKHQPMARDVKLKLEKYFEPLDEEWKKIITENNMALDSTTVKHEPAKFLWAHEELNPKKGRKIDQEWEGTGKLYGSGGI